MKEIPQESLPGTQQELYASFSPKIVDQNSFEIITGRGNIPLAQAVGKLLGKTPDQPCSNFADGEIAIEIKPNLRGREVFILQSMNPSPNDRIQEVVLMADASKRADAQEITAIIPYFAYARQDRKPKSRTPISASRVAKQLVGAGINRILTIDIHAEQSEGSIDQAWDNVHSDKLIGESIRKRNLGRTVVLAADIGSAKRSEKFSARLSNGVDIAIAYKKRDVNIHDESKAKVIIGDVKNRLVIIYDDLISTGNTLLNAAYLAKQNGATKVIAAAVLGIFVPNKQDGKTLPQKLKDQDCPIDELIVTDTILQKEEILNNERIKIVSVAPTLAIAILCYLTHDSIGKRLIDRKRTLSRDLNSFGILTFHC